MLLGAWNSNGGPTNHFWPCWRGKLQNSSQQRSSLIIVVWIELNWHICCILYVASYSLTRMLDHWRSRVSSSWSHHDYKRDLSLTAHALHGTVLAALAWKKAPRSRTRGIARWNWCHINIYIYKYIYIISIESYWTQSKYVSFGTDWSWSHFEAHKWQISLDVSCSFGLRWNDMADSKSHESKGMRSLERHESSEKCYINAWSSRPSLTVEWPNWSTWAINA